MINQAYDPERVLMLWHCGSSYGMDKITFIKLVGECEACSQTNSLTIDHIIPKSRRGRDEWGNWQVLCFQCNAMKGDWHPSFGGLPPCLCSKHDFSDRTEFKQRHILAMMRLVCRGYPEYEDTIVELGAVL